MNKIILTGLMAVLGSGCATGYNRAVDWQNVGNGVYEIDAKGNAFTNVRDVKLYTLRAAFELCKNEEGKGFTVVSNSYGMQHESDGIQSTLESSLGSPTVVTQQISKRRAKARAVVRCEGPVSEALDNLYASND